MANLLYLQTTKATSFTGTYGNIQVTCIKEGAVVSKYANKSNIDTFYNEYCLAKEAAIMWHLKQQRSRIGIARFPILYSSDHLHANLFNRSLNITTGIHQEYTGPSLLICHKSGFLVNPGKILTDTVKACQFLEKAGVMHLDIKNNNATLDLDKGIIKLIDFGYSQLTDVACTANTGIESIEKYLPTGEHLCVVDCGERGKYNFSHAFNTGGQVPMAIESIPFQPAKACHLQQSAYNIRFRDPTMLCAEALGVSKGLHHDSRLDLFAAAMVVLHSMNGEPSIYSDNEGSAVQNTEAMFAFLSMVRGSLSSGEAEVLRSTLLNASVKSARSIRGSPKRYALLQHLIQHVQKMAIGNKALIKHIYGVPFATALFGVTHPVQSLRDTSDECLKKLQEPPVHVQPFSSSPWCMNKKISFTSSAKGDGSCIFRALLFEHVIVSVVVKEGDMLWCAVLPVFDRLKRKDKATIALKAAKVLHQLCCTCTRKVHDVMWYMALNRAKRLDVAVNGVRDQLKELLAM